ncbi:MAG: divalent metal cation transporter [Planctomycetaceae bacterium]|nr:divalent metal cation transporter [Planctomycetaceae bacterium]
MSDQTPSSPAPAVEKPAERARRGWLAAIGPAIITASVVLGPGSILSASKIGWQHGYAMTWVLVLAIGLMIGMTALSARLGVLLNGTLCDELATRAGRPVAAFTGVSLFLIAACFQFSNNLGVLAALEPFFDPAEATAAARYWKIGAIVGLNAFIITVLFGFKKLYGSVEKLMKLLVGLMLVGFAGNLIMAKPSLTGLLGGLIPTVPEGTGQALIPTWKDGGIVDGLAPLVAMFATTFSVAAAYYQSYLVRQKGWGREDLRQGVVDSAVGISVLGGLTLMVMATAASVLHGNPAVTALNSAGDVALQLEPAFGQGAKVLFCLGIFAGAFSSFLVNAAIGGSILSDGFGLGGYLDMKWPKICTTLALLMGMVVAVYVEYTGQRPVNLIIFAQALTVLGVPVLAIAMLWLATRSDMTGKNQVPLWMKVIGGVGLIAAVVLALRTALTLWLKLSH